MNQQDLWSWTACNSLNFSFFIVKTETKIGSSHSYVKHFPETCHNWYLLLSKFITFECSLNFPDLISVTLVTVYAENKTLSLTSRVGVCVHTDTRASNRPRSVHLCLQDWVWFIWRLNIIFFLCHLTFWVVCCRHLEIFRLFYWHIGSQAWKYLCSVFPSALR